MARFLSDASSYKVVNPRVLCSKGIVVLLGWTASRIKPLTKYANIYSELGIASICVAPSLLDVWLVSCGNAKAKKIVKGVDENSEEGSGVVLHLFSGSSITFLPTFLKHLHLSGIIFDSGPVSFSARPGLAAAKLMRQQGGFGPIGYYASCTGGLVVNGVLGGIRRKSMRAMLDHPAMLQIPQLYLYSSSDSVASMEDIEDETKLQVSRGADVSSHCWHGSEHVRHFLEYPEEYTSQIHKFIHKLGLAV